MTLAGAGRTEHQHVFLRLDEVERREFQHVAFRQARVVAPVEAREIFALGESRERVAPIEQSRAPPIEFILHEPGEGFEEIHLVIGDLQRARFERGSHAGEAEIAERAFEFRDRHGHGWFRAWGVWGVRVPERLVFGDGADDVIGLRERRCAGAVSCARVLRDAFQRALDGGVGEARGVEQVDRTPLRCRRADTCA